MTDSLVPRKPGRPRDPDLEARRRSDILTVAAKTFAELGFAATDVQVIADQLGVGKGTIYRYFPTKESLFLATVQSGLDELTAEMDAVLAEPGDDGISLIQRAIRTYLSFFHRRPEMAELFVQERAAFKDRHRALYFAKDSTCDAQHVQFYNRLVASGTIRPIPVERLFAVIGDLLYGMILTNLISGRPADPVQQTEDVLDVILNGICAQTAPTVPRT